MKSHFLKKAASVPRLVPRRKTSGQERQSAKIEKWNMEHGPRRNSFLELLILGMNAFFARLSSLNLISCMRPRPCSTFVPLFPLLFQEKLFHDGNRGRRSFFNWLSCVFLMMRLERFYDSHLLLFLRRLEPISVPLFHLLWDQNHRGWRRL